MIKPIVAIVGRPNVGKSTFFNRMAGGRVAIVEDVPGVTRDRIYADVEWQGMMFTLVDTGGIDPYSEDVLLREMRRQAELAIETAQTILFFCDGREGLVGADEEVADMLRRSGKTVLLVINKIDHGGLEMEIADFWTLGLGEPIPISSANMLGLGDLLDEITATLPPQGDTLEVDEDAPIQVAVVGRPNVGKSSTINRILGEDRVMVSDIPGTTRDAIDTPIEVDGQKYVLIDTAGMRRKRAIEEKTLERYSVIRALAAVRRCDVGVIVLDATAGITEQDVRVAGYVHEEGKASVVVVNKWDLIEKETGTAEQFKKLVIEGLKFMDYTRVIFTSALSGQRVHRILREVFEVYAQATRRITTGVLNDALSDAMAMNPPPFDGGRQLRVYYATQVAIGPPTFVFFVNDPALMHYSYERYLENQMRKFFGFEGTPLKFILRKKAKED